MHEVERPDLFEPVRCHEGSTHARRNATSGPPRQVQAEGVIHAVDPFVIPTVAVEKQPVIALPRTPTGDWPRQPAGGPRSLPRPARWRPPAGHTTPPGPVRRRGRRDGPRADALSSTPRWTDDARPALQSSAQDIPDGGVLQRERGIHPLQLHVLRLEFLQPLELGDARARVLRPPVEIRRAADAVLPHQIGDRDPRLTFLQDANDLTLRDRDFRMATPSRAPESPTFSGPAAGEAYRRVATATARAS